jgi:hypothetical protein
MKVRILTSLPIFFTPDAIENNRPFHELLPEYPRNMEKVESLNYRIELLEYSQQPGKDNVRIKGKFFTQYLLNKALKEKTGNIMMDLIESGESYLVKRLDYIPMSEEN